MGDGIASEFKLKGECTLSKCIQLRVDEEGKELQSKGNVGVAENYVGMRW